jgi:uncharacterized membrane protein (DUF4010 family)
VLSETTYIAGLAVFVTGFLLAVGGAPTLGVAGACVGGLLWVLARNFRRAELRNHRAFYGDPRPHASSVADF